MGIDADDKLHAVWGTRDGIFNSWCDVSGRNGYAKVSQPAAWKKTSAQQCFEQITDAQARLGDLAIAPNNQLWIVYSQEGNIVVTRPVDGIGPRGKFEVEVVDADSGKPVPGFERSDFHSINSGLDIPVEWDGGTRLSDIKRANFIFRFYLTENEVRFHAFRFTKKGTI